MLFISSYTYLCKNKKNDFPIHMAKRNNNLVEYGIVSNTYQTCLDLVQKSKYMRRVTFFVSKLPSLP